ncbi:MAG TPA: glycoside hydrolase family 125 protein [Pyrinomonadaceae bacterium]|nr:glycoside hydrolase family 125 protein [Pyrinomonadaceae bacterium]
MKTSAKTYERRTVIKSLGYTALGVAFGGNRVLSHAFSSANHGFVSKRPTIGQRKFVSEAVEAKIVQVKRAITDAELAWLFENCFANTLDTTVTFGAHEGRPDTYVITGDINAMWLRDSTAQITPYLPFAREDKKLKEMIAGVINRQTRCILIDPYANSFDFGAKACPWGERDKPPIRAELCERKWEIDSLCYPVRLAHAYWKTTGDSSCFHADWVQANKRIVQTFREQQRKKDAGSYTFTRTTDNPSDTAPFEGRGNPTRSVGLIHSAFRPSDDACIYPFLIPSNFFAVVALNQLVEIFSVELSNKSFARECQDLAHEVKAALETYGKARHAKHNSIYAYEVDGFGNQLFMDDANAPSLLSLPYFGGCAADDATYLNTRGFVLSEDNPYFFRGRAGEGIGGPHVGLNMIWPLGIIMRALTSRDDREILFCLRMLKTTHAGTGFMHESFDRNDSQKFTRSWFAWANTLFGELVLKIHSERPHLLIR